MTERCWVFKDWIWRATMPMGRCAGAMQVHSELRPAASRKQQRRSAAATATSDAAARPQPQPQRVAVIGGGFAGLAVSWHLLSSARDSGRPMQLHLFDAYGLGAGGSGAAAGLLHPYTPRGKMLWQGLAAFHDAIALLQAAEAAMAEVAGTASATQAAATALAGSVEMAAGPIRWPFAWRHGMLRPARSAKQARDIARFLPADPAAAAATRAEAVTDGAVLSALVPGLQPELLLPKEGLAPPQEQTAAAAGGKPQPQQQQRQRQGRQQRQQQQASATGPPALGLMVNEAVTIHPASYLHALWLACQLAAGQAGGGTAATLRLQPVTSLRQLQAAEGPFDAIVVAAGAAVGSIQELEGCLPLDLCHGYSLDMRPASSSSSSTRTGASGGNSGGSSEASNCSTSAGTGGESKSKGEEGRSRGSGSTTTTGSSGSDNDSSTVTGASCCGSDSSTITGSSGSGSGSCSRGYPEGAPSLLGSPYIAAHGSSSLVVGATKRYGLSSAEAFSQLSSPLASTASEAEAAAAALLPAAQQLWPPLEGWQVEAVRAGVRALPVRGSDGSIPYAGRLPLGASDTASAACAASGGAFDAASPGTGDAAAQQSPLPSCWVIGGLGARGLVYHAWLGRLVAAAVLAGSEASLPAELLRWKAPAASEG